MMAPTDWRHLAEDQGEVCAEFMLAGVQPALCYSMAVAAGHFGRLWLKWANERRQYMEETFPWL